jgi:hypothetical protein
MAKNALGPLFLLSPAKALDMKVGALDIAKGYTQPQLLQQTETLVEVRLACLPFFFFLLCFPFFLSFLSLLLVVSVRFVPLCDSGAR